MDDSAFTLNIVAWTPQGVVAVPLGSKRGIRAYAWIDECDEPEIGSHRWYVNNQGYAARSVYWREDGHKRQQTLLMHRVVLGLPVGDARRIDHRNHNQLDNRRANIRIATHAENHQNRRATGDRGRSSQYRGVCYRGGPRPWQAYAQVHGKQHHLGFFGTEVEAAAAAVAFRREHMPFATD